MDFQSPTTWQELKQIVDAGVLNELSVEYKRSVELTQLYESERNTVSKEAAIQNIYTEINQSCTTLPTGEEVALTNNKYPYDRLLQNLPGVTHVLLWFKGSVSPETAKAYLRSLGKTCCLYENPAALKSIPEISHYQVFLLNTPVSFALPTAA
ncbi:MULTISPECIES: hypothetical protein [unclassified Leptolyngbya]|uniref:hypothetical protein n=1 Tax=unclassified Leptolyngbya TaxID=2650499 RepID=UPI0016891BBB|nr:MULTISPECIES: hypothetical protein [unclassified Leptolyngbya]MBD1909191.1 hypothetical protein [Leptolyngbya sp. FACHB-8]MBD2158427.1 hypothetical protein [Leptolyngbya sp. FACHB-16]